jgi:hypothetical protein
MCVCVCMCFYVFMYLCIYVFMYVCMCVCAYVRMRVCAYVRVCFYSCIIYNYRRKSQEVPIGTSFRTLIGTPIRTPIQKSERACICISGSIYAYITYLKLHSCEAPLRLLSNELPRKRQKCARRRCVYLK